MLFECHLRKYGGDHIFSSQELYLSLATFNLVGIVCTYLNTRTLTLILPEPKVLVFATSIEPDQPAHQCSLNRLYCWLTNFKFSP